jgi:hypothetical protein
MTLAMEAQKLDPLETSWHFGGGVITMIIFNLEQHTLPTARRLL